MLDMNASRTRKSNGLNRKVNQDSVRKQIHESKTLLYVDEQH